METLNEGEASEVLDGQIGNWASGMTADLVILQGTLVVQYVIVYCLCE